MLTIKQGKDLSLTIEDLECGDCFLYSGHHYRKIDETNGMADCYNFTDNYVQSLGVVTRVRRMPLTLSEEGASRKIFFVVCQNLTDIKSKFVVDYCTSSKEGACKYCDKQCQRQNTWSVYEAEIGTEFGAWDEIHVAPRGTD